MILTRRVIKMLRLRESKIALNTFTLRLHGFVTLRNPRKTHTLRVTTSYLMIVHILIYLFQPPKVVKLPTYQDLYSVEREAWKESKEEKEQPKGNHKLRLCNNSEISFMPQRRYVIIR